MNSTKNTKEVKTEKSWNRGERNKGKGGPHGESLLNDEDELVSLLELLKKVKTRSMIIASFLLHDLLL